MSDEPNKKTHYKTALGIVNSLSARNKRQLIYAVLNWMSEDDLRELADKFPIAIQKQITIAQEKKRQREDWLNRIKSGDITPGEPLPPGFIVEERTIVANGKPCGPYFYLRWWEDKKLKTKYLGKKDPRY